MNRNMSVGATRNLRSKSIRNLRIGQLFKLSECGRIYVYYGWNGVKGGWEYRDYNNVSHPHYCEQEKQVMTINKYQQ